MDNSNNNFLIGEIVWAKIRGYPWWPATVSEINDENKEKKYICNFIGDNSHASLFKRDLAKFEKELDNFSQTKKKDLLSAINEAKSLYFEDINIMKKNQVKEKGFDENNVINSKEDKNSNNKLTKKKRKRIYSKNNNISKKKNPLKTNNSFIPVYKGKDKENADIINKIILYLLYITRHIQNKNITILEEEKETFSKVLEFLKDYKMNEPIHFLKKTNIGKMLKYININVPEGEFKEYTNAVCTNLEEQVVAQLFQKNK